MSVEKIDSKSSTLNRQYLPPSFCTSIRDEEGAVAPIHQTVLITLVIALLLTGTGQPIYHTSPGPVGKVMNDLRNGGKSVELLPYPGGRNKFVRIGTDEKPEQGPLTPESFRETLQWLNKHAR